MGEWAFTALWGVALVVAIGVPLYAGRVRGRGYAVYAAVVLALSLPGALVSGVRLAGLAGERLAPLVAAAFALGVAVAGLHLAHLVRARLRGPWFRWAVSVPGQAFVAAGFLAGAWLLAWLPARALLFALGADAALAALRPLDAVPFALAAVSVGTSLRPRLERVHVALAAAGPEQVTRIPVVRVRQRWSAPAPPATPDTLRLVQITDPHLGPWQPVERLQRSLERLLAESPDLVLLTGDFLTMEGQGTPGALARALAPLRAAEGRCFAVFGNHDHEAPDEVRAALAGNGVDLLVDDARSVSTRCGAVQIVGADYVRRERRAHLHALLARHPRRAEVLRLLLLHDPIGFHDLPPGDVDLTLSGHTHGGQIGLVSLGLDWTVLGRSRWPDHGLFARGASRLYVHRGTGFYGFPLRIGVPGEHSVLDLALAPPAA